MLLFAEKVFESIVNGTQSVFTDVGFAELLGSAEVLTLAGVLYGVSGATPSITLQVQHSPDFQRWMDRNASPELSTTLAADYVMLPVATDGSALTKPSLPYVRVKITLGGTGPKALLRLFASGGSPRR